MRRSLNVACSLWTASGGRVASSPGGMHPPSQLGILGQPPRPRCRNLKIAQTQERTQRGFVVFSPVFVFVWVRRSGKIPPTGSGCLLCNLPPLLRRQLLGPRWPALCSTQATQGSGSLLTQLLRRVLGRLGWFLRRGFFHYAEGVDCEVMRRLFAFRWLLVHVLRV